MNRMTQIGLVVAALLATGCTTTIRNVTATYWTSDGLYVGYWEGACKPFLGCGVGDGKVKWCALEADNSLLCREQDDLGRLLSRNAND